MSAVRATPVKVSPIIRGARYSLLLCGIIYGLNKKAIYEMYERRERPRREQIIHDREEKQKIKSKVDFRSLLSIFADALGIDLPPDL